ncbi:MAG: hypothetical protein AB7T49_12925 [Oligoflexales bacterium]
MRRWVVPFKAIGFLVLALSSCKDNSGFSGNNAKNSPATPKTQTQGPTGTPTTQPQGQGDIQVQNPSPGTSQPENKIFTDCSEAKEGFKNSVKGLGFCCSLVSGVPYPFFFHKTFEATANGDLQNACGSFELACGKFKGADGNSGDHVFSDHGDSATPTSEACSTMGFTPFTGTAKDLEEVTARRDIVWFQVRKTTYKENTVYDIYDGAVHEIGSIKP